MVLKENFRQPETMEVPASTTVNGNIVLSPVGDSQLVLQLCILLLSDVFSLALVFVCYSFPFFPACGFSFSFFLFREYIGSSLPFQPDSIFFFFFYFYFHAPTWLDFYFNCFLFLNLITLHPFRNKGFPPSHCKWWSYFSFFEFKFKNMEN